jgi:hypothetical protein
MMAHTYLIRLYSISIGIVSLAALIYVYAFPPESMQVSRNGVPHFMPPVTNPNSGESMSLDELVRHYRGD